MARTWPRLSYSFRICYEFAEFALSRSIPNDLLGDDGVERIVVVRGVLVHGGVQVERGGDARQDVVCPFQDLRILVPATA